MENSVPKTTLENLKVRTGSGGIARIPVFFYLNGTPLAGNLVGFDHNSALIWTPQDRRMRVPKNTPAKIQIES